MLESHPTIQPTYPRQSFQNDTSALSVDILFSEFISPLIPYDNYNDVLFLSNFLRMLLFSINDIFRVLRFVPTQ